MILVLLPGLDGTGRLFGPFLQRASGALDCSVASEDPGGYGFGDAALRIARGMRVAPTTSDGRSVEGGHVRVPLTFRAD